MKTFKKDLSDLADFALEISGTKNDYTEEDLNNALLVFFEVFSSLTYDHHKSNLNFKQMKILFYEAGISLNQTVKLFTGVDTKESFKRTGENNE